MNVQAAEHPIVSARRIIDIHPPDMKVGVAKTLLGLKHDVVAANPDRIIDREAVTVAAIIIAVLIPGAIALICIIPIAARPLVAALYLCLSLGLLSRSLNLPLIYRRLVPALRLNIPRLDNAALVVAPSQIEGVAFGAAVPIFNVDHRGSTLARVANQVLTAPPVDSGEMEVRRIRGHR